MVGRYPESVRHPGGGSEALTSSADVRRLLVDTLRRDLVGPGADDADLARERLTENPSRWYLTGFLAPSEDDPPEDDPATQEEIELEAEPPEAAGAGVPPATRMRPKPPTPVAAFCRLPLA